jgi:CRP-like cAMP-binding protein
MPKLKLYNKFLNLNLFTDEELADIIKPIKTKKLRKRDIMVTEGEINRSFYYVNTGLFKAYMTNEVGDKFNVQFYKEDYWMTDLECYLNGRASLTTIECIEHAEIAIYNYEDIEQLMQTNHKFENYFRGLLQQKLISMYKDRFNLISMSAEQRYIDFVNKDQILAERINQKDIASFLGIFPESLSRIRRQLYSKD